MTTDDPLRAFLSFRDQVLSGAKPFEGGEHLWIGYEGATRATKRLSVGSFGPFKRKKAQEELSYGEIVAFSGDFYESPADLFNEQPSPLPWLWEPNDLGDLLEVFKRELTWIKLSPTQRGTAYPDQNVALWWNAKQYAELALRNTGHFGWHNALAYVRWHEAALALAAQAAQETDREAKSLLWREAVYTNGFADHFLTDGFAAGHVRTPAAQIRQWAEASGRNEKLAGALVKVIHDQDGHINELHSEVDHSGSAGGLHVVNAQGTEWYTRCDGQLFLTGVEDPAIEQAVEAVAASVEELLRAYQGTPVVEGVFAATERIPWPHPDEKALITKFPADLSDARAKELCDSIQWYVRLPRISAGIRPQDIQACCGALPALMQAFRNEVAEQAGQSPIVLRRLAPKLVEAYKAIR
ncbi:hypothetical protein [Hyalangium sp.]|uniref:hypothetical protein n=1 Tax=Hyalangium sp. TaxID=2028555 RepID=UPI002D27BBF3|nr:hypothetical protein [Hyalangium sp.]HYH99355.1 hypothetical protein [Hyalangium sp.]